MSASVRRVSSFGPTSEGAELIASECDIAAMGSAVPPRSPAWLGMAGVPCIARTPKTTSRLTMTNRSRGRAIAARDPSAFSTYAAYPGGVTARISPKLAGGCSQATPTWMALRSAGHLGSSFEAGPSAVEQVDDTDVSRTTLLARARWSCYLLGTYYGT